MNTNKGAQKADVLQVQQTCVNVMANVSKVIIGKEEVVQLLLVALLSEGHVLIEDVPGVGKTMLARAVALTLGCSFNRIQFTPDLLPSDVTGVSVFDPKTSEFVFRPGPIVAQIVLADEINRATPRTQSSLLECMAEGQITIDGRTRPLPKPFLVLATQNPVEYEGTFPLPEAQLDRFFMKISMGYPSLSDENELLSRFQLQHPIETLETWTNPDVFCAMQQEVRQVYVESSVRDYMVRIVQATRTHPDVVLGASPRATLALFRGSQALAALEGRDFVLPDDVKRLTEPVLSHRVVIGPESQLRGQTSRHLIREVVAGIPVKFEENLG